MGNSVQELGEIYRRAGKHASIRFCIDTAHLMGAGIDFRDASSLKSLKEEIEKEIGLKNVILFHLNDSKVDLGEKKDRHENIGDGFVGSKGFKALLRDSDFKNTHSVLEVPGLEGGGPDKANIDRLKAICSQ